MGPPGPRVAALVSDLISASRIESAVAAAGGTMTRIEAIAELPAVDTLDLLVVDWGARRPEWGLALVSWREGGGEPGARIVLFGPHTDLDAHAEARAAGLGPMTARSAFFSALPRLLSPPAG